MKKLLSLFLLFLILTGFLGGMQPVSAAITNPYTVDEKSQVLFGDSTEIVSVVTSMSGSVSTTTYKGLENYTQDYVNGFIHITFTYTHHSNNFAGYPPSLYITNIN